MIQLLFKMQVYIYLNNNILKTIKKTLPARFYFSFQDIQLNHLYQYNFKIEYIVILYLLCTFEEFYNFYQVQ